MTDKLRERVKQTEPFEGPDQKAMLSLLVAAAAVRKRLEKISNDHDLFGSQYNILRILGGGPPEGYPRQEIIDRMIDRSPDVTRLADDLEEKGLLTRERSDEDRRVILHRLTDDGRRRLEEVTDDLRPVHRAFSDELTEEELEELSRLSTIIFQRFD